MTRALVSPVVSLLCGFGVFAIAGCAENKRATTGWAAEVPADAVRFVPQSAKVATAAPTAPVAPPANTPPPAPVKRAWGKAITAPTEITLWHAYRATEKDALEKVVAAWDALHTNVTVKLRPVPPDAFNDKITVVVPEGRGPDIFIFAHDLVGAWAEMGFIEPLNGWTDENDTSFFLPNMVKALVYRDGLYGLPLAFKCVALYYDKAAVPTPPKTVEDLLAVAGKFTDGKDHFGLVYEAANLYFHAPWVHGFGGQVLDGSDKAHVSAPESLSALLFAKDLVGKYKVTPSNVTSAMVSGYFNDHKAAMVINGPWMLGEISGVDYGVTVLPEVAAGKPARPYLGVEAAYLNKRSEKKAAAVEFMRFLVSDEAATIRFEVGRQPVCNARVWDTAKADPVMNGFKEQSKNAVLMPSSPRMQQVWTPYNGALLSVLSGEADPKTVLETAQTQIDADMARATGGTP